MTSAQLVGVLAGKINVGDTQIPVTPDDVYTNANLAQAEILQEIPLLERKGNLTLAKGQDEYHFQAVTITAASNASPISITAPLHGFNTGDTVIISGVLVNTAANARWLTITVVDANTFTLDGSVGNGVGTGGIAYHDLMSAWEVKHIKRLDTPYGIIPVKSFVEAENYRSNFDAITPGSSTPQNTDIVKCYQILEDDSLRLIFMGIPQLVVKTAIFYTRQPLPSEIISATVDPILPRGFDRLLITGTRFHILNNNNNVKANAEATNMEKEYLLRLNRAGRLNRKRRFIRREDPAGLKWGRT